MEGTRCIICRRKTDLIPYLRIQGEEGNFSYQQCTSCGLIFLNPRPEAQEILKYYESEYYGGGDKKFRSWIEAPRLFFAWQRVRRLQKFFPHEGRALDIGCGQGTFLKLLQDEGWTVQGTEIAEKPARRAMKLGLSISIGELKDNQFSENSLDLVTLWQVIEHLPEPAAVMRRLRPMLRKKGIVAISTPNIDSLQARVFREKWFHLDPPRHLFLFSPKTLQRLLAKEGFRLIHLRHFSLEQNPYGWIHSALNCLPFPQDALYTFLKSKPPQSVPEQRGWRTSWVLGKMLLLSIGFLPTALFFSTLMGGLKRGATFEAYFEKEG